MQRLVRPSFRLVGLLLVGVLPALLVPVSGLFAHLAWGIDALLVAAVLLDLWLLRQERVTAHLAAPPRISRQTAFEMRLTLHNLAERARTFALTQRHPEPIEPREDAQTRRLGAGEMFESSTTCQAVRRGTYVLCAPVIASATPLGLGVATLWPSENQNLEVLPSTRDLGRFDALVRQQKLHQMGLARVRQRGAGNEIAGLRPYTLGDPLARIDWKATARRGSPISREMHTERRQNLLVMLDCGRRMAREVDGATRLDDAIEAALLLSHVALRSDDRVGLMAFADTMLRVVPPVRGVASAGLLAQAMFDLSPVLREPAYEAMAVRLHAHFPKRSLVVLFTDAVEPESLQGLARPIRFLSQRHLVLLVTFRDASVAHALAHAGDDTDSFFRAGAASDLSVERERNLARLRGAGAQVLEAAPGKLSTDVINRYLQIKARHLL